MSQTLLGLHADVATEMALLPPLLSCMGSDSIAGRYEAGSVQVWDNVPLDCDVAWLQSVFFRADDDSATRRQRYADQPPAVVSPDRVRASVNFLGKIKPRKMLEPITKATYAQHVLAIPFPGDYLSAQRFQQQVLQVNVQMREWFSRLFPRYRLVDMNDYSWRLLGISGEEMHYDSYAGKDDSLNRLRLFINLDSKPRWWRVGPPVTASLEKYWQACHLDQRPLTHPNELNNQLNMRLPWKEIPAHDVLFAPLSAWIVNSQVVAHEAVWGRKLLSYTFALDPGSLLDPASDFVARVDGLRQRLSRPAGNPLDAGRQAG